MGENVAIMPLHGLYKKVKTPEHAGECRKPPIFGEKSRGADFRISEAFYKIEKEVIIEAFLSIL